MKKFLGLIFAAAAVAAVASPPNIQNRRVHLAPGAKEKIAQIHEAIAAQADAQSVAAPAGTSGSAWTSRINVGLEKWLNFLCIDGENTPQFSEMPLYWTVLYTHDDNAEKPTRIYYDLFWPATAIADHWNESDWFKGKELADFDWARAEKEYGSLEAAQAPAPVASVAKMMETEGPAYVLPSGMVPSYYGCANIQFLNLIPHVCTFEGTSDYQLKPAKLASSAVDFTGAASLLIKSYDEETMKMEFSMYAPMGTPAPGYDVTVKGLVDETVNAAVPSFGFSPITVVPDEVHIFNLGAADQEFNLGEGNTLGDYFENFSPAQMYCVAYCNFPYTFDGTYDASTLPAEPVAAAEVPAAGANYAVKYFTLEQNLTDDAPQGIAQEFFYKADEQGALVSEIKPGLIFPVYYIPQNAGSQAVTAALKGTSVTYGWSNEPYPFEVQDPADSRIFKIGLGDKNFGFNSHYVSSLGAEMNVTFKGELLYHYDPADFTKIKTTPAVGTAEASTLSVEGVSADGGAQVVGREYYNFQGVRMAEAPEKGLYIVRELKSDGSASVKKIAR